MSFGKPRYNKKYDFELIRYCSSKEVTGGSQKILAEFKSMYPDKSLVSYCDNSKFSGETYTKLGFKLIKKPHPTRHWYNVKEKSHITDNLLRQRGYDKIFGTNFGKGTSNEELMLASGYFEIYDCGQSTYVLE